MSEERAQYGEAEPLAQHTPGPWEARLLCADGEIVRTAAWEISTPGYDVVAHASHCGPIRKASDARLIAAAPDLLNIAKRVVSALEDLEDDPPPRYRTHWHDLRDDARAALNHAAPAPAPQQGGSDEPENTALR